MKLKYSKLTNHQTRYLVKAFVLGVPALSAAKFAKVHRNTASKFFKKIRLKIAEELSNNQEKLKGEIEIDESYFGGRRKGNRGRGASGKQIVFGILERGGQVRTIIVEDVTAETLLNEIVHNTEKGCVYCTDLFRSYNSLSRFGKHQKVDHQSEFSHSDNHINGIEGFWSYAKRFLQKYNGVSKKNFYLYLKEIEWRFNNRQNPDLERLLLKLL